MQINIFSRQHKDSIKAVSVIFILAINLAPVANVFADVSNSDPVASVETASSSDLQDPTLNSSAANTPSESVSDEPASNADEPIEETNSPSSPSIPPPSSPS